MDCLIRGLSDSGIILPLFLDFFLSTGKYYLLGFLASITYLLVSTRKYVLQTMELILAGSKVSPTKAWSCSACPSEWLPSCRQHEDPDWQIKKIKAQNPWLLTAEKGHWK